MKRILIYHFLGISLIVLFSCNGNNEQQPQNKTAAEEQKQPVIDTIIQAAPAKPFANVNFASKRDTICGMPISAGLSDTVILNGKVYGFCAKECKDEFVQQLITKHKR